MHRLEEKLQKRLAGQRYGSLQSIFKGQGVSISDTRRYQPGDHIASVNWKQTAKHDQLYINEYEAERSAQVYLFCDINANRSQWIDQSNRVLIRSLLADYILFAQQENLLTTWIIDTNNHLSFEKLPDQSARMRRYATVEQHVAQEQNTRYKSCLSDFLTYAKTVTKRCVYVIISDFLSLSTQEREILQRLDGKNIVVSVRVPVDLNIWNEYNFLTTQNHLSNMPDLELL